MVSREQRAQAKRRQILDGARTVFLARGFAGAGTDAIAAEAGVSKQTLYAYFPTKEDLLVGAMRELVRELPVEALPEEALPAPDDAGQLRDALVDLVAGFSEAVMQPEYLGLMRVLITEAGRQPELAAAFTAAAPDRLLGHVRQLRRRAVRTGLLADVGDEDVHVRMLLGPLLMWAMVDGLLAAGSDPRPPHRDRLEALVDLWLRAAEVRTVTVGDSGGVGLP